MAQKQQHLTGYDKVAILFMILGEDAISRLFPYMDDHEIKQINMAMTKLSTIPQDKINNVIGEFHSVIDTKSGILADGDFLKRIISKTLEGERATYLLNSLEGIEDAPLKSIHNFDSELVTAIIKREHPQTIAVILTIIENDKASEILSLLPEELQTEVVLRMASMDKVTSDVIREIDKALSKEIEKMKLKTVGESINMGGIDPVVTLLNRMGESAERTILGNIEKINPELAVQIRRKMIVFEDLMNLDDRSIQEILKEVKTEDLTISLKSASSELKEKIFKNMSERAADILREELEIMGPVKIADVIRVQQSVCEIAKRLEEEGKIVIIRGDEDYV